MDVNCHAFSLVLATFDAARRWRDANQLAQRVDLFDVRPDEALMHAVITLAGRASDMPYARATFERMRSSAGLVMTTYRCVQHDHPPRHL